MANCTYNGQEYSEGSVTCQNGNEFVCQSGAWNRTGAQCSSDARTTVTLNAVGEYEGTEKVVAAERCVSFIPGTYPGTIVPLNNTCDKAKQTKILWNDRTISQYCVAPHTVVWINTGGKNGNIIDEVPC
jgi:hypothetical protein